ncbi:MAG: hypothetical protein WCV81_00065 [Microgenomates group bacterium]|jgi:hypothetical protein
MSALLRKVVGCRLSVIGLFLFIIFAVNFFILTPSVFAADNWQKLNPSNYQDRIATQRYFTNLIVAANVAMSGEDPLNGPAYSEKVTVTSTDGAYNMNSVPGIGPGDKQGGMIGMATKSIASIISTRPTSSQEYLANLGENIGIAPKPAYAQITGSGQNVIDPVLKLWQVTRNIAYTGFILVFMAAGVMIMFRQKLNPQTVIGIQQALPGIVVGLILVTFSYFIAALIVDLSFVGTRLVTEIFVSSGETNYFGCTVKCEEGGNPKQKNIDGLRQTYKDSDAFNMFQRVALRVNNVTDVFRNVWGTLITNPDVPPEPESQEALLQRLSVTTPLPGDEAAVSFAGAGGAVIKDQGIQGVVAMGVATIASLLVPLILMIALMIQFIKLIIALLISYLQILLMVIFGPILIMVSAIPGRGGALSYWLKALFANALVFPAVFAGFLFAGLLLEWAGTSGPTFTANMPMFGGLHANVLKSLLAFGVLLGLPAIPDMVRDAMGVKTPQGFMKAAVGGFMGGIGGAQAGYGQAMQRTGLSARKEAMEKAQLETAAHNRPGEGGPQNTGERILSWLPSGGRR